MDWQSKESGTPTSIGNIAVQVAEAALHTNSVEAGHVSGRGVDHVDTDDEWEDNYVIMPVSPVPMLVVMNLDLPRSGEVTPTQAATDASPACSAVRKRVGWRGLPSRAKKDLQRKGVDSTIWYAALNALVRSAEPDVAPSFTEIERRAVAMAARGGMN
mmetsp:Transcript_123912/g.309703  ORF Transcript_123912/g.309703 Transcript_123912/m.309703 type:complete len:158 (-) Transcript_123912:10-483(-)